MEKQNHSVGHYGIKISQQDQDLLKYKEVKTSYKPREKELDLKLQDLVEYTKWITAETAKLRGRV